MTNPLSDKLLFAQIALWCVRRGRLLAARSRWLVAALDVRMELLIPIWIIVFALAAVPRMVFALSPVRTVLDLIQIVLPYALIALAPILGYRLAAGTFPKGLVSRQPVLRIAKLGRWQGIDALSARQHPEFGPWGFMASLLVGLMLNVPVRSFEFLLSVPAMNHYAPQWGETIFRVMAFDVIAMNFLYMVCFVMALRSIPLFPRMLALTWAFDLVSQLIIARSVAASPYVPPQVAMALQDLLMSNIQKVLISVFVWLPYLLLSNRVNVTYRCRLPASP
jgi:hypothetical protein